MENVISVENMRKSDERTIATSVPSLELMRRAAEGIRSCHDYPGSTLIVVGSGNNGGDGFALAQILLSEGKEVSVLSVTDHYSPDSSYYMDKCVNMGLSVIPFESGKDQMKGHDTIVDCLLGTGFKGDVRGSYKAAIEEINASGSFVISADINSGMNGDTGEAPLAVMSDITVTIGCHKTGILLARKGPFVKKVICAYIGIDPIYEENYLLTSSEWEEKGFPSSSDQVSVGGIIYFLEEDLG